MAKVRFSFGSRAAFDRMAAKDPSTVYFVNETGDFSSASLDADGDIYLGEKLLTGGGDGGGGAAAIPAVTNQPNVLQSNVLYQFVLEKSKNFTLSADFNESVANEWHLVVTTEFDGLGLRISAPSINGYNCVILGNDQASLSVGHVYDIRILYTGTMRTCPTGFTGAVSTSRLPYKVFLMSCTEH